MFKYMVTVYVIVRICLTLVSANTIVDCQTQVCIPNTLRSLKSNEPVLLKASWDQLITIFRPHHMNMVKELWLNNIDNKTTALSIGSVIRRAYNVHTLNLQNYSYNAIQVPLDGKQKHLYNDLKQINELNVKHLNSETLKWLGGLDSLQITLTNSARSRYPDFGKIKNLKIYAPHTYTLNALYFGRHCKIENLHLTMPQAIEIMPQALIKCKKLKSITVDAPKVILMSQLIVYNINLMSLNLQIESISPTASISSLICKFTKANICSIDEIHLEVKHSLPLNVIGENVLFNMLDVTITGECNAVVLNPGRNFFISTLNVQNTPVMFHEMANGMTVKLEQLNMKYICSPTLHWIEYFDLIIINEISITYSNISDISALTFKPCPNLKLLNISHNAIKNSVLLFTNMHALTHIDISHNKLTAVQLTYTGFHLNHLDLSHNSITHINLALVINSSSYSINLSHNKLINVEHLIVLSGSINFIDLRHNEIVDLHALQQMTLPQPTTIEITHNPFQCTCLNIKAIQWAKQQRHIIMQSKCAPKPGYICEPEPKNSTLHFLLERLHQINQKSNTSWDSFDDWSHL